MFTYHTFIIHSLYMDDMNPQMYCFPLNQQGGTGLQVLQSGQGTGGSRLVHQPSHDVTADVDCGRNNDPFHLGEF